LFYVITLQTTFHIRLPANQILNHFRNVLSITRCLNPRIGKRTKYLKKEKRKKKKKKKFLKKKGKKKKKKL